MDKHGSQRAGAGRARVHDDAVPANDRHDSDTEGDNGSGRARVLDAPPPSGGEGAQHHPADPPQSDELRLRQRAQETGRELRSSADAWTNSGAAAIGAAAHFALAWQRELAEFYGMRVDKDLQYGQRLLDVRHPQDLFRLNASFTRELVSDYAGSLRDISEQSLREARQRTREAMRQAGEAAEHLREGAERALAAR